ncbi:putative bifunctional diguanylate cyclase/phosphodiesterase [Acetobacter syzygii]|uniref:Bifunctional diguanylate cyclase/phosphodiesterase n=1 Tax=Acetobacter syzygii TaxID=146476 RepID=A0A270BNP9_9PROT|nr:bifunctional diguanylate cyclase/phosphodiesterase [Acetobacter syzygii]PAL26524.1 bifunctional diguanylate cyclase/phosphodiesterase [Acetobacter syzygii]PAL26708.1 bifunctional diguanylate cyclase/phosphodiesterase [Acetobacter syzygii]
MMVVRCILGQHNLWLVCVAALLCCCGSGVTASLFRHALRAKTNQWYAWLFLTALSSGVAIWCTHFVAMLGYGTGAPARFDPLLTSISLLIAVFGSTIGFTLATCRFARFLPEIGGAIVGLAIVAMHYTGMLAYRVQGQTTWNMPCLVISVLAAVVLCVLAVRMGVKGGRRATASMAAVLALAVLSVHFIGMAAYHVQVTSHAAAIAGQGDDSIVLAAAIAIMSFLIVGGGLVSGMIDDSSRADSVEKLRRMALNDPLTGLPNRMNFHQRLDLELDWARETNGKLALVGIDLNRFKEINDLRGHKAGDEVLRILGRRLRAVLQDNSSEFIARTGGDEFQALCRMTSAEQIKVFLHRLEEVLFKPIRFEDSEVQSGASLGVAIWPDHASDKEALINNADLAMYRAKADPGRHPCFYEPSMDEKVRNRRKLAADLRDAVKAGQLTVCYQVQRVVATGEIRGFEALVRWQHPTRGTIMPDDFIPLAEESDLILQIGEWVLRSVCAEAVLWQQPYKVAVNLSGIQFVHTDIARVVANVLEQTGLPPERLELELTESTIIADQPRALQVLRQIKSMGVSLALDDFGTGYSSLDTLRRFSFDRIKIDRSFFGAVQASDQTLAVVHAVLALGKAFDIPVMAEGIETADQLNMLHEVGCEEAQGFLLGRPACLDDIVKNGQITMNRVA